MPAPAAAALTLLPPTMDRLPAYAAALEAGWSPNTSRDVSGEQLTAIRADPEAFLRDLNRHEGGGTIVLPGGKEVTRLPGRVLWMWDGDFCGSINLRLVPGTEDLPPHVSGHIGYAVVPWKRRRGYATRALALMLPVAAEVGLARVLVTCDDDNEFSRRVIEANGGEFVGTTPHADEASKRKLLFWIGIREKLPTVPVACANP